jgi:two-component system response regulator EvgA
MNKVLIVDDHPVIRLAVRMLMERHGYEVMAETDNGVDALQLTRASAGHCHSGYWNSQTGWARGHCPNDLGKPGKQGAGADSQAPGHFSMRCMQAGAAGMSASNRS